MNAPRVACLAALYCAIMIAGCTDAGVDPAPGTLPRAASLAEARRLIVGRWTWVAYYRGLDECPVPVRSDIAFSNDGVARSYWDGQLSRVEHYAVLQVGDEYALVLDSTGWQSDFRIAGKYFAWDSRPWDGDARLYQRTGK
jgi:hypothetical protein